MKYNRFCKGLAQGEKRDSSRVVLIGHDLVDQVQNHSHKQHRSVCHWDLISNCTNDDTDSP
jgi:hypothetical protein